MKDTITQHPKNKISQYITPRDPEEKVLHSRMLLLETLHEELGGIGTKLKQEYERLCYSLRGISLLDIELQKSQEF